MIFRLRYMEQGGHTFVRVFAGETEGALGKCGDLIFRNEEWKEFQQDLFPNVQIMKEERHYEQALSR